MALKKFNLKGRRLFQEEHRMCDYYFWMTVEEDKMHKFQSESSLLKYLNETTQDRKMYNILQPFRFTRKSK